MLAGPAASEDDRPGANAYRGVGRPMIVGF